MDSSFKLAEGLKELKEFKLEEKEEEENEVFKSKSGSSQLSWKEQQVLKMLSTPDQKPSEFSVQGQAHSPSPFKVQQEIQNQFKSKDLLFKEIQESIQNLKEKQDQKQIDTSTIKTLQKSLQLIQETKRQESQLLFQQKELKILKDMQYMSQNSLKSEILTLKQQLKEAQTSREQVTDIVKVPIIQTVKEKQEQVQKRPALNREILTKGVSSQRRQYLMYQGQNPEQFSIEEEEKESGGSSQDSNDCNVVYSDEEEHAGVGNVQLDFSLQELNQEFVKQISSIGIQTEDQKAEIDISVPDEAINEIDINIQQAKEIQQEMTLETNQLESEIKSILNQSQQSQPIDMNSIENLSSLIETLEERFCSQALLWEQEIMKESKMNSKLKEENKEIRKQMKESDQESLQAVFQYKKLKKDVQVLYKQLMCYLPQRKEQEEDEDYLGALLAVMAESRKIKQEHLDLIETIGENKRDLLLLTHSSLSISPSKPISEIQSLKDAFNQQKEAQEKQFLSKLELTEDQVRKEKEKLVEQIKQNNELQKELSFSQQEQKLNKEQVQNKEREIGQQKEEIENLKKKNGQIILRKEQNEETIRELTERNHVLIDSVDKLKLEILSFKKQVSKMEAEALEKEKELESNKKRIQQNEDQFQLLLSEKEHLLSLVDFNQKDFEKQQVFKSGSFGGFKEQRRQIQTPKFDPSSSYQDPETDVFKALKGLTSLVMGRDLSPSKKKQKSFEQEIGSDNFNLLKQLFSENAVEMLELYENRVEQRDLEIDRLESELEHYVNQNIGLEEELTALIETITNLADVYDDLKEQQVEVSPPKIEQLIYRFSKMKIEYNQQLNSLRQSHGKNQIKLKSIQEQTNLRSQLFKASLDMERESESPSKRLKQDISSRYQLQIKELNYQVETLQLSNEQILIENDAFRRDLKQAKKREEYLVVLRKKTEQQKEQIKKMLKEQDKINRKLLEQETSKSEMGRVVSKMDQELKREKGNVQILRQQLHEQIFDAVSTKQQDQFDEDSSFQILGEIKDSKTEQKKNENSSGLNITMGSLLSSPDKQQSRNEKLTSQNPQATKSHQILPTQKQTQKIQPQQQQQEVVLLKNRQQQLMAIIENQAQQLENYLVEKKEKEVQVELIVQEFHQPSPQQQQQQLQVYQEDEGEEGYQYGQEEEEPNFERLEEEKQEVEEDGAYLESQDQYLQGEGETLITFENRREAGEYEDEMSGDEGWLQN